MNEIELVEGRGRVNWTRSKPDYKGRTHLVADFFYLFGPIDRGKRLGRSWCLHFRAGGGTRWFPSMKEAKKFAEKRNHHTSKIQNKSLEELIKYRNRLTEILGDTQRKLNAAQEEIDRLTKTRVEG